MLVEDDRKLLVFGGNGAPLPLPLPQSANPSKGADHSAGQGDDASAEADAKLDADAAAEARHAPSSYLADLWALDLGTWEWHKLQPSGSVRHAGRV